MPPPFSPYRAYLERGSGSSIAIRTLSFTAPHRYQPSTQTVEAEIQDEVDSQQSNSQVRGATQDGPATKFQDLSERNLVCNTLVQTITKDMGLETMTPVQSKTINETLRGIDVLAQARTGTGKTLAFLIPVLQNIINYDPSLERRTQRRSPIDIRAIVISPTRELAEQIAVEAKKLTRKTGVIVQTAVGGTAKGMHLRQMREQGCHLLVGTPGRLNDLLSDPYSKVRAPNLSAFVLDEADRLLDAGFLPEIKSIQQQLPSRRDIDRQTLLFSATVPDEVMEIVRETMKPDFQFVRTVQIGEQQTHDRIPQKQVSVRGFANFLPALLELCKRGLASRDSAMPFKAIVYFGATADVILAAQTFMNLKTPGSSVFHKHPLHPARIIEMHARLSQAHRTRAADNFRRADSAIMFSSDVTARGMDFPNVTHVIQMGAPTSRDTYIHRVGRTGRGDKPGEGWLILTDFEAREARHRLTKLPLVRDESLETGQVDMSQDAQLPEHVATSLTQIVDASRAIPREQKAAAYLATLGVYQWIPHKQDLVDSLNDRAKYCWAMEEPPSVGPGLASKLGLSRTRGLVIRSSRFDNDPSPSFNQDRSSGYQSGGSPGYRRGGSSSHSNFGRGGNFERGGYSNGWDGGDFDRGGPPRNFQRSGARSYDRDNRESSFDRPRRENSRNSGYGSRDRSRSSGYGQEYL
ncbi:MAG: hypothetical protein Q9195_001929 [Heterodermia aff. obscurata]